MTSPITPAGGNWQNEANRLRQAGYAMPNNPVMARLEARKVADSIGRGSLTDLMNRQRTAEMNRSRLASTRGSTGSLIRTASDVQMALPKIRQPLSSLSDKGVPFNVNDPKELIELRRWCRLYYATHDLVPLLIDIYSKFPVTGMEFVCKDPLIEKFYTQMFLDDLNYEEFLPDAIGREYFVCLTKGTPVMTSTGHRPIEDIRPGDQVLTRSGQFKPVIDTAITPVDEDVVSIRPRFGQPVTMTARHRVWVRRDGVAQWVHAEDVRSQQQEGSPDQVFVPALAVPQQSTISLWDHLDPTQWRSFANALADPPNKQRGVRGNTVSGIQRRMETEGYSPEDIFGAVGADRHCCPARHRVDLTEDLLWFIGLVVGDGHAQPDKSQITIALNGHETALAERAAKVWYQLTGRDAHIKTVKNHLLVRCYDLVWTHVLRDMTYHENGARRLPSWFASLPPELAEALYLGLSESDGYSHPSGLCVTQSDRYLIEDIASLARQSGIVPRVYNLKSHHTSWSRKDQYVVRPAQHESYFERVEGGYWVTVWKSGEEHYSGDVYDLTVQDDHTFVTSGFVVHNCGEVTTLAHFNEQLGIWSSEEVLNPDMIAVSKSLFVEEERVQLLVKDLVESLRQGPNGSVDSKERPSERLERNFEYQQLVKYYPEILQAAARDDGLDISDALVSRLVNRANPWDLRGTPPLLRSMRTLLMEEELNAAQDAVASRLYAPMILATMGIDNMGNDEPWIPSQGELDDLRDDMQSALAADFKLLVHNFGVKVESVFGRESVPDFSNDYDRIDAKLMQAWGIGSALIMGGTGAGGAYASSALNREVCEQLMVGFQKKVVRHIRKRMEIIAEAQEHYDYELKGGLRVPLYREIVEEDPETGEQRIVRVPKLLIPEVKFSCVVPGTQILTPTGQRSVEDIQPGDEVIAWDGTGYVIDTALHTGIEHRDRLVEVATATGRTVRCTADHPFWTDRGWVLAENLTTDSLIRTSAGQLAAHVESDDDLDMLRFLGLLVGDGNYSTTHVSLSVSDPEVDAFVCEQAERMGLTARRKADARTDKVWYRTFVRPAPWKGNALRNPLHTLLREQGMWGKNGHAKRVPPMVWAAGAKGRAAFLSGYFDADGYACRTSGLKITSVNRLLLDDCQVLFESLGIRAQVRSYAYRYDGQKNPGVQSVNHLTVSNNHYFQMLRDTLSPIIGSKTAALDDMARPSTRGRKAPRPVEWDQVTSVTHLAEGGDIVTLGITSTHTHVTAGLVSHNTLNLRDETQERMFITQLKQMGVPISDKALAVNIQVDFEQELEREAQETVDKGMAKAQAFKKMQDLCDLEGLPYPPELVMHLQATLQLRQMLSQTTMAEDQAKMMDDQTKAASAAGQLGAMPGTQPMPGAPGADMMGGGGPPQEGGPQSTPPQASGPSSPPPEDPSGGGGGAAPEPARNRQRPEESDEMRANAPRAASARWAKRVHKAKKGEPQDDRPPTKFELGPSSVGRSRYASEDQVAAAIQRREMYARHRGTPLVSQLVTDPEFYKM